ncbi:type IV pilus assembly PilZ [Shewanella denitrificans OS217]|uniref:Type IV pilus assembly PilZ n=1 Tax=Shewanella denitrificans (strain OS217 / ATCC BAA-1090 / DSM 15013) TaxID=318161 RepID=Q12QF4_SHEDO|nr:PilZ domain-containing protein [Shewanella denitrificans]ABE54322.1 type IV pilus assembly PilZ [Shewanella denitrificans OS217]
MSLDNHNALIEQLKPLLMEPDFQEIFTQLTADESNSTRFLIKMELNRLAGICTRIIDMRGKSELECQEISLGGVTHFLDEPAQNALLQALPLYRNKYTLGVYEHVIKAHKKYLYKQQFLQSKAQSGTQDVNEFVVPAVVLGNYFSRTEERMNYSIKVRMLQQGISEFSGTTLDLSVSGARIKLDVNQVIDTDRPLIVKLSALNEDEYFEELQLGVEYKVVDLQHNSKDTIIRLKRLGNAESLDKLIHELIDSYKYRYKLDVNDVFVTATGLGFERHYLPLFKHLPLYLTLEQQQYQISHELLNVGNAEIQSFFKDEHANCQLSAMLTEVRLSKIVNQAEDPNHRLFFCFTHNANGRVHFYSASLAELIQTQTQALFFGFGAKKDSWRVFKLNLHQIDHQQHYKSSTLQGDDPLYSADTEQELKQMTHVLQLQDVTNPSIKEHYQAWVYYNDVNDLKAFAQAKVKNNSVKRLSMPFSERRHEARYSFKSSVDISQGDKKASGISCDISSRGLQIKLDDKIDFTCPAAVQLSFPKLQTIAGNVQLDQLNYQLVQTRYQGTHLHLSAILGHTPHVGVEFMNKLIAQNKGKLTQLSEPNGALKELSDGMKNLLTRQFAGVPFFIEKTSKSAKIACLGIGTKVDDISHLFAAGTENTLQYNLGPLLENGQFKQHYLEPCKKMKHQHRLNFFEVFIQVKHHARGSISLTTRHLDELISKEAQLQFIRGGQKAGKFTALRIYIGAAEKSDLSYIRRELEYITSQAKHKAHQLEERLNSIIGVGELLDVTQEVLCRYPELTIEQ